MNVIRIKRHREWGRSASGYEGFQLARPRGEPLVEAGFLALPGFQFCRPILTGELVAVENGHAERFHLGEEPGRISGPWLRR